MASSVHSSDERRTEFRLLKPMPSRQEADDGPAQGVRGEAWDTQIRRLFPSRETPVSELPAVTGIQLGHFEIEERIARGGMGTVFRARDLRLDRDVALKVLSQDQLRDPAAVQRFQNEARAAAKLDHENIARVYYIGEDRGVHFIAFEYVHGTTVREAIGTKGFLTQDEAVNFTLQAAEALRHTDMSGVVHRDIKPSNLIVTPSGRVKLVDLGLARQTAPTEADDLTVTGTTLGTFDYISPEQARDPRNVDVRSDIYSLGCSLFQMLTGSPPYPRGSSVDKLLQHSSGRPPDPCELNPRVSPRLALVVQRMMASNPDDRYASPQSLIDELSGIAEGLGLRATAPEGTIWRKPIYRTSSRWWDENRGWVLAFAGIVLLAIIGSDLHRLLNSYRTARLTQSAPAGPVVIPATSPIETAQNGADVPVEPASRPESPAAPSTSDGVDGSRATTTVVKEGPRLPEPNVTTEVASDSGPPARTSAPPPDSSIARVGPELTAPVMPSTDAKADVKTNIARGDVEGSVAASNALQALAPSGSPGPRAAAAAGEGTVLGPATPGRVTPAASSPVAVESPFVVFGADGKESGRFETLEAACHVAKSGAVVEIHYDGRLERSQKPILIQGKRLTIRPSPGFRPLIVFAPGDEALGRTSVNMIDVIDGAVELYDVDLAMQVTNDVFADQWVMLSATRVQEVVLRRVSMTIANVGWRPAVMVERRTPADAPGRMMPSTDAMLQTEIQVDDCLFRGNASLYVDRTLEPASVRISDSAVAVDGDVFRLEGADRADMEVGARSLPQVRIELDHISAFTGGSVVRLWSETVRELPDVRMDCRNSILDVSRPGGPLVLLEGHQDSDALLQRLRWGGSRNVIVIHPDQGCLVRGLWPQAGGDEEWTYTLGQWQSQWQTEWELSSDAVSDRSVLTWEPDATAAHSTVQVSDFALRPMASREPENPALGTASDSSDRGFRPSLSSLPPELPDSSRR
ncbi:MAG: protein kinase [Planctomycetaceae bacterium]|nr:protein kinase [Planctomycetaceae bacterium]